MIKVKVLFGEFLICSEELCSLVGDFFEDVITDISSIPRNFIQDVNTLKKNLKLYEEDDQLIDEKAAVSKEFVDWVANGVGWETPKLTIHKEIYDFQKKIVRS